MEILRDIDGTINSDGDLEYTCNMDAAIEIVHNKFESTCNVESYYVDKSQVFNYSPIIGMPNEKNTGTFVENLVNTDMATLVDSNGNQYEYTPVCVPEYEALGTISTHLYLIDTTSKTQSTYQFSINLEDVINNVNS